jgi:uncharacterized protein YgiM (DUF1202 family)
MDLQRMAKAALGVLVLVVLFMLIANWIVDYRAASRGGVKADTETTGTVAPAPAASPTQASPQPQPSQQSASQKVLVVQVQGLNFRQKPSGTARAYRGLSQGEKVYLISQEGDWYKVQDSSGTVGFITSNPAYTKPE